MFSLVITQSDAQQLVSTRNQVTTCIIWTIWCLFPGSSSVEKRGFKIFQLSPDAIDLTLCQLTVGESEHIQAEDTGFSEQGDYTIIHYHHQGNEENKYLYWHGRLSFTL